MQNYTSRWMEKNFHKTVAVYNLNCQGNWMEIDNLNEHNQFLYVFDCNGFYYLAYILSCETTYHAKI